jgi:NAD+ kinase
MTVAIYARSTKDNLPVYVEQLWRIFEKEKVKLVIFKEYYEFLQKEHNFTIQIPTYSNSKELIAKANYVISLGGDGTMLETVALVRKSNIPVLGVNTGRLGFLATVNKDDLEKAALMLINSRFTLDKRALIELSGCENCFDEVNYALNEFTIHKQDSGAMIHVDTYVDGVFLNSYFADGLIVSTPTGSTAYSLSCGGPIMMPDSNNFIITPIAPHNLNMRPMIIPNKKEISFKVSGRSDKFLVSLDSVTSAIAPQTEITIKLADFKFNLINLEGMHFFGTLRNKLLWGIDKRQ